MDRPEPGTLKHEIRLRDVAEEDLPLFFAHQRDPVATQMTSFPPRDRPAFMRHWAGILADETLTKQTILVDGQVAGNIVSWEQFGEREVGYWLGREYWGQGVATQALAAFLQQHPARPLYAHVAQHNGASRRVLEKCGFTVCGESHDFAGVDGEPVAEWVLILRAEESAAPEV